MKLQQFFTPKRKNPCDSAPLRKLLFQLCSHKDKEAYMIKGAAGYGKGKKGKNLFFFFQNSIMLQVNLVPFSCRFEALVYFTFWIIP